MASAVAARGEHRPAQARAVVVADGEGGEQAEREPGEDDDGDQRPEVGGDRVAGLRADGADVERRALRDLLRDAAVDRAHVDAQAGGEPDRLEARAPVHERDVDVERALVAGRGAQADRPDGEVLLLAEGDEGEVAAGERGGDHGEHREDAEGSGHPVP